MKKEIFACFRKDLLNLLSYKFPFFLRIAHNYLSTFVILAVSYFVTQHSGKKLPLSYSEVYKITPFFFVLSGIMFGMYFLRVLSYFSRRVEEERRMGVMEALLVTPTYFTTIIVSMYIYNSIVTSIIVFPILMFGVYVLNINFTFLMISTIAILFILTAIAFVGIAMLLSSFIITFEKGRSIAPMLHSVFTIFGGIFFPVAILPKGLQVFSYFVPISYSMRVFRHVLFESYTFTNIVPDLATLLTFSLILWISGIFFIKCSLIKARKSGSLSCY